MILVYVIDFVVVFVVVVQWKQVWTLIANHDPVVVGYQWQVEWVEQLVSFVDTWQLVVVYLLFVV